MFTLNVTNQAYRTQYICTQPYICTIHMLLWHVILQYIMLKSQPSVHFFLAPLRQMTWQCNDMEKNISPGSVDCRWTGSFHANAALVEQLREMARHRSDQWFALLWCTCQLILSRPAHLCCNVFNLFMHYITANPNSDLWFVRILRWASFSSKEKRCVESWVHMLSYSRRFCLFISSQ